jgi:hypothetical protein
MKRINGSAKGLWAPGKRPVENPHRVFHGPAGVHSLTTPSTSQPKASLTGLKTHFQIVGAVDTVENPSARNRLIAG